MCGNRGALRAVKPGKGFWFNLVQTVRGASRALMKQLSEGFERHGPTTALLG